MFIYFLYLGYFLTFILHIHGGSQSSSVSHRNSKLFYPFIYLNIENYSCQAKREDKIVNAGCTTKIECNKKGKPIGTCAQGYGACCLINAQCKDGAKEVKVGGDSSNFTNLVPPSGENRKNRDCEFILIKRPGTVQLRLDFTKFQTADADQSGNCMDNERLTITGSTLSSLGPFVVCGDLTGQHMYLEYGESNEIRINIQLKKESSTYRIVLTQMFINNPNIAPSNCLQYFQDQVGKVSSFGFPKQQTNNQKYSICIESKGKYSSIKWSGCKEEKGNFLISGNNLIELPFTNAPTCNRDYIQILGTEKKCGNYFGEVTSSAKPYVLWVNFDNTEGDVPMQLPIARENCINGFIPDHDCSWYNEICTCSFLVQPDSNLPNFWDKEVNNTGFCLEYAII